MFLIPTVHIPFLYYKLFKGNERFIFQQSEYRYFIQEYNTTWRNERAVEIPVVCQMLNERKGKVLEIGNVLSHYFDFKHAIVDKYEKAEDVINEDVTTLELKSRYDTIVSISTLEHVGWDEKSSSEKLMDRNKIPLAISRLKTLLNHQGIIIFTVPLGHNPYLDELIKTQKLNVQNQFFLKRISKNKWVESDWDGVKNSKYGFPYSQGNAIMLGIVRNN